MSLHCSDRICHLSLVKAGITTFQEKICDAGREMQTNSEEMRCKESPVVLHTRLSTRRVRGREETGEIGTERYIGCA